MKSFLTNTLFICLALLGFDQFGLKSTPLQLTRSLISVRDKDALRRTLAAHQVTQKPGIIPSQQATTDLGCAKNYEWPTIRHNNEPPKVDIDILQGNQTFFFPDRPIQYAIRVVDVEDGSLADGRISTDRVTVRMDYFSKRFDSTTTLSQTQVANESPVYATAQRIIAESDCRACHTVNKPGVGPTYGQIAQKYNGNSDAVDRLARKVIAGGRGVWGEATMSPHPQLSFTDATTIVTYILSLSELRSPTTTLPVAGVYTPVVPEAEKGEGYFRLLASYTDRGTQSTGPIKSEQVKFFRSPVLLPQQATWAKRAELAYTQNRSFSASEPNSYLGYSQLDMTDISQLIIKAKAPARETALAGTIEVRLGSPTGKLIGSTSIGPSNRLPSADSVTAKNKDILTDLMPTTGVHDVYFLFKNSQASPQQVLMQIDGLIFKLLPSGSVNR